MWHEHISLKDRGPPHTIVDMGRPAWSRSLEDVTISDELAVIEAADGWIWLEDWSVLLNRDIAA